MLVTEKIETAFGEAFIKIKKAGYEMLDVPVFADISPHADLAVNVALKLGVTKGGKKLEPFTAAELLIENLPPIPQVKGWQAVRPGFINITLSDKFFEDELSAALTLGQQYGDLKQAKKIKIILEYLSANPTGPLTLANSRGGYYGDVLGRVLKKAGFDVTREYYFNDDPYNNTQMQLLGKSVLAELGLIEDMEMRYRGEYITKIAKRVLQSTPKLKETKDIYVAGQMAGELVMELEIKPVLSLAGIEFDSFFHEGTLYSGGDVLATIVILMEKKWAYEKDGALWFKATKFGDTQDWVLRKSNGEYTYVASDLAYFLNKFEKRKFDLAITILGADHHAHAQKIQRVMGELGHPDKAEYIITQIVRLIRDGKELKMSKRAGTYVSLAELIEEVSPDVVRYFYVMRSPESHMDFDLELAKEQSQKNPVFYVQYAHARLAGILRQTEEKPELNFGLLVTQEERQLILQLIRFPILIKDVSRSRAVYHLATYAHELASAFHLFYDRNRVIQDDLPLMKSRLALVKAAQIVLKNVLTIIGVSSPEKM